MVTMSDIREAYAATEEKESNFDSISCYGRFDKNADYSFHEQPFEYDDYLLWC